MTILKSVLLAAAAAGAMGQPVPSLIDTNPQAAAAVDMSQLPVVDIDSVPSASIFGSSASTIQPQAAATSQGGGYTANGLRIAIGGQFQSTQVANGAYFPSFDVRSKGVGSQQVVRGVQSSQPWTQASVNAALGTAGGTRYQSRSFTITSDSDMTTALNFATTWNGAFLGGAASVEGSFGYSTSSNTTMHRVSGLAFGRLALPTTVLADPAQLQLDPTPGGALDLLKSDVNSFLDTYGTHFIKNKAYGCQATALYTFSCQSQEASHNIAAALKANYNGGTYSVGGSVSTKYDTYSSLSICEYQGDFQATGMGKATISPSNSEMMNQTLMDGFWDNFGDNCIAANAQGQSELLYIELGNWLEVPAVRAAVSGNSTAMGALSFYAGIQASDLSALMMGSLFEHNLDLAISNTDNAGPSVFAPFARHALFDRSGMGTGPIPQQYWQGLAQAHQGIKARRVSTNFNTYLSDAQVTQAIASNTPATMLVQKYWADISQLYKDATAVYQYAYTGVTAVARSFAAGQPAGQPVSHTISASASQPCNVEGDLCAVGSIAAPWGSMDITIQTDDSNLVMMLGVGARVDASGYGAVASVDLTSQNRDQGANPVTLPIRMDLTVQYCMPDTSLWATPYAA